jgi:hypothetical protein
VIEDHAAGTSGALIDSSDVSGHNHLPEEDELIVYQNSGSSEKKDRKGLYFRNGYYPFCD